MTKTPPSHPRLRIAIAGVGSMGIRHLTKLLQRHDADVIALADPDAKAMAAALQVVSEHRPDAALPRTFSDSEEMLRESNIEAVVIASPADSHAALTLSALTAGASVLVEKPLAPTVAECRMIVQMEEGPLEPRPRSRLPTVQVGHIERFNPAVRALLSEVRSGLIGGVREVRAIRRGPAPQFDGRARLGAALDLAIHDIDIILEVMASMPTSVEGASGPTSVDARPEEWVRGSLAFANGATAFVEAAWWPTSRVRSLVISGEAGTLELDYMSQALYHVSPGGARNLSQVATGDPLVRQHDAFIEAVRVGGRSPVPAVIGLRAVQVVTAVLDAARSATAVAFDRTNGRHSARH